MSRAKKLKIRQERQANREMDSVMSNNAFIANKNKYQLNFKILYKERYLKDTREGTSSKTKLVAYTSISPNHSNYSNQMASIESWNKLGIKIYSLNISEEIRALKNKYPSYVNFIESKNTTKHISGKPCIIINEMIDHFRENNTGDILMLINSDIILKTTQELIFKIKSISEICIPISHRINYKEDFSAGNKYAFGFDVFFIHKKYVNIFPPSLYSMGQTWWDYWLPYTALKNKIPVFIIQDWFAFHKEHPVQYNEKDWIKMTEYFKWENNITQGSYQQINDDTRNEIINNSLSFNLCQSK